MDAVPIVPPLFWGTKNTTLHELQTGDRSRATDTTPADAIPPPLSVRQFELERSLSQTGDGHAAAAICQANWRWGTCLAAQSRSTAGEQVIPYWLFQLRCRECARWCRNRTSVR